MDLRLGAALVMTVLLAAAPATGQVLVNTGFDSTLDGWRVLVDSLVAWDPLDAGTSPASGSALVENVHATGSYSAAASQCVTGVRPGGRYAFGAQAYVPGGQAPTGSASAAVMWFEGGCGSSPLEYVGSPVIGSTSTGAWLPTRRELTAPATADAVEVFVQVWKNEAGGSLRAHFDDVFLVDLTIFQDGFEDGTTDAWAPAP